MNSIAQGNHKSVNWFAIILGSLGFWLSGSFILDFVVIPSLSLTGMMESDDFASAGFTIFNIFNHIELVCSAVVLTGVLVLSFNHYLQGKKQVLFLSFSSILLLIALAYTYIFIPNLTGWGLSLHQFGTTVEMPKSMIVWQGGYWVLEGIKFILGITILRWCNQNLSDLDIN
jgi:hypothetical protein